MKTTAIVLSEPRHIGVRTLDLTPPRDGDLLVEIAHSGISTGTERLLWSGTMPAFPGMGYPLVPGYEAVGRVVERHGDSAIAVGQTVFVPGASCYEGARGLFGASASRLIVRADRALPIDSSIGENGILLALAATAYHTFAGAALPELIVGHGVLGRLLARLVVAVGGAAPTVWEINADRRSGAQGYEVVDPAADERRDYRVITDVSGAPGILDSLVAHLAPAGEIVLGGFYSDPLSFVFPPAFMREARFRVAAQWQRTDLEAVRALVEDGRLSLDGLITHRAAADQADLAYRTAFENPGCLKMVLDWRAS
ncbi:chlorophyll synthesis pathway protein BchC [Beijerinckia sp. L45]|uniref:chlorophyll synthesis pathway protein BchC n=1 Tax=Beijerinckia sp. L45 TaxID=1641855 RepID=UPI00131CEC58|nr:chlorophyll synthesis pathway protein BchC [Beijerinckia sp. L45]